MLTLQENMYLFWACCQNGKISLNELIIELEKSETE